ncbi:hypothetical protein ID866_2953 [Astraeus odoratus]|nr:hypothetical protein ID866_2953 [Astraeus odoratus]
MPSPRRRAVAEGRVIAPLLPTRHLRTLPAVENSSSILWSMVTHTVVVHLELIGSSTTPRRTFAHVLLTLRHRHRTVSSNVA